MNENTLELEGSIVVFGLGWNMIGSDDGGDVEMAASDGSNEYNASFLTSQFFPSTILSKTQLECLSRRQLAGICQRKGLCNSMADNGTAIQLLLEDQLTCDDLDITELKRLLEFDTSPTRASLWDKFIQRVSAGGPKSFPPVQCSIGHLDQLSEETLAAICNRTRGISTHPSKPKNELIQSLRDERITYGDLLNDELTEIVSAEWNISEAIDDEKDGVLVDHGSRRGPIFSRTRFIQYLSTVTAASMMSLPTSSPPLENHHSPIHPNWPAASSLHQPTLRLADQNDQQTPPMKRSKLIESKLVPSFCCSLFTNANSELFYLNLMTPPA